MAQIKRFGFAVQALMVLAASPELRASADIAERIRCEPTALRKIMAQLGEAGIVEVKQGRAGGYQLLRRPAEIRLIDVFSAMPGDEQEWDRMLDSTGSHLFGRNVRDSFHRILTEIHEQVAGVLANYTVADLMD